MIVVVFKKDKHGARVLTNPSPEEYLDHPHLIDPCMDQVENLSPHAWKIEKGKLVPDSDKNTEAKRAALHSPLPQLRKKSSVPIWDYLALLSINIGITLLLLKVLHKCL